MKRSALAIVLLVAAAHAVSAAPRALRVCADPDNLPYSDRTGQGFENAIAQLLARDLGTTVEYTWWAQQRGYVRKTIKADRCDLWIGVASGVAALATTAPYYRSSYVFVTRADRHLDIRALDDARLRELTIGVQMIGNDATNTPPAHALAQRGLIDNVRGYMVYAAHGAMPPPIVAAVADGTVDVAIVWGPQAGYFAKRSQVPLRIEPIAGQPAGPWPMAFDIAVGVRPDDPALKEDIDDALTRQQEAIDRVLDSYAVPRVEASRRLAGK